MSSILRSLGVGVTAFSAGTLAGAAVLVLWYLAGSRVPAALGHGPGARLMLGLVVMSSAIPAITGSAAGALAAAPIWLLLHRLRLAGWASAAGLGLVLSETLAMLLLGPRLGPAWAAFGAAGLLAGLTTWGVERGLTGPRRA